MALSLAVIIIFGMAVNFLFTKMKLPGLLGMLLVGVIIGPYCLNWIDKSIINISSDIRKIALMIILLRAGLGIKVKEIAKVGKTALFMSFIPGLFEGLAVSVASIWLLKLDFIRGGMLGFILAAVLPAVFVPLMLKFIEEKKELDKGIPILILSAASIDDVVAITGFTTFLGFYINGNINIGLQFLNIPISIFLGIVLGLVIGTILIWLFNKLHIRDTKKVILILAVAIFMTELEHVLADYIVIASLLGVMSLGFMITENKPELGERLSKKFSKLWLFAELLLFVLVGAEVNIDVALHAGLKGLVVIVIVLVFRSLGVSLATINSGLNIREKLFVIISYIPKATVQAAIGSIPLMSGVQGGELILAFAVLSIIFTAPLGSLLISITGEKVLSKSETFN